MPHGTGRGRTCDLRNFSPSLCQLSYRPLKAWLDLNQQPLDLQSNALPLSYRPCAREGGLGFDPRISHTQCDVFPINTTLPFLLCVKFWIVSLFCIINLSMDKSETQQKRAQYKREWDAKNRERVREYNRQYYHAKIRERKIAYLKEYRRRKKEENPEAYRQSYLKYRRRKMQEDPQGFLLKRRKHNKKYRRSFKGFSRDAKERGIPMTLSKKELEILQDSRCNYCVASDDIGVDRIDSNGPYSWDNVVSCCKTCNYMKGRLSMDTFIQLVCAITTSHYDVTPRVSSPGRRGSCVLSDYTKGARRRNLKFQLSNEDFKQIVSRPCHYCGLPQASGIDRKDNSLGYVLNNVVASCATCNFCKHTSNYDDFLSKCAQIMYVQMSLSEPPARRQ